MEEANSIRYLGGKQTQNRKSMGEGQREGGSILARATSKRQREKRRKKQTKTEKNKSCGEGSQPTLSSPDSTHVPRRSLRYEAPCPALPRCSFSLALLTDHHQ